MEITKSKLDNYILMSNKNLDKLFKTMVCESCNGLYLESFDDKMLLADSNTGSIYMADYKFDGQKLTIENYEMLEITQDERNLSEAISNYFDDQASVANIAEAYSEDAELDNSELHDSIVEALAQKGTDCPDYTQLVGINESLQELQETNLYKNYAARLAEKPLSEAKVFDWVNPIQISLIDEDENLSIVSNLKEKGKLLSKDKEFKKLFAEAAADFQNGDQETMRELLECNNGILALDETEFKEFIGMSVIGNKDLMAARSELAKGINEMVSEDESLDLIKSMLSEEEGEDEQDKELEASDKDIQALKDALDKALENITDEKLVSKINSLKDALEDSGTINVGAVKESVYLLSL